MTFDKESEFKGIPTWVYSASDDAMAGIDRNPENECFCMDSNRDHCRVNGIFDLAPCQNGIPIIVSLPHFLGVDESVTSKMEGLAPDPEKHRPVVHVEPTMGTVLHGDGKLQFAIRVAPNSYVHGFENLDSELYIPLLWGYKVSVIALERR